MIEQSIIDKIISQINIVDVIGQYITLTKRGVNFWGICPFHTDSNPSMCVSPSKQIFKCFSCGTAGNVITFLEKYENISYPEAIRELGKRCGIEVESKELTSEEQEREKKKESLLIALKKANEIFTRDLKTSEQAKTYLKGRGWDADKDAELNKYGVGYAANEWRHLIDTMKASSFDSDTLVSAGLATKGEKGYYDSFRDRIIFPFRDLRGNTIGFTGRIIDPGNVAKYYNTSETMLFHKGSAVFGLYEARQSIGQMDKVYFVEGQFDVLSFVKKRLCNTICGSGTALTAEQIKIIRRFTNNITLVYDGDEAGQHAAIKNLKALIEAGAYVRAIQMPEGEDPDSFARSRKEKEFTLYLSNQELDWVTFLSNIFKVDFDDPIKKNDHFCLLCELIAKVRDKSLRTNYMTKLSDQFKMSMEEIKNKIKEFKKDAPEENKKPGFYGIEELGNTLPDISENCILTDVFSEFREAYGESAIVYVTGVPSSDQIQELRRHAAYLQYTCSTNISFDERRESDMLTTLVNLHKSGFTIYVTFGESNFEFVDFYLRQYSNAMEDRTGDIKTIFFGRCADIISSASEASQTVMEKDWCSILKLTAKSYKELLKPYRDKKKSKNAMLQQQSYDDSLIWQDPDTVPDYVNESEEYSTMYKRQGYYPLLNKEKQPVCYMFKNPSGGGHLQVADFYMIPLLHIYSNDAEGNKRIIRINRRYYKKPLYLEIKSKIFASLNSFEEALVNEEGVNFENGTVTQFKKIRQSMSYNYTLCNEIKIYGQQTENFYAFSNAIFHEVDGVPRVDMADDIGVVTHNEMNYYEPAFSNIYTANRKDDDMYKSLRYFIFKNIPKEQQCSFEKWTDLMNQVYKVNDNGKWAILYAILCAFRSDIHPIDRLFTAIFFMGPTMSGKTQIAISIRSLYIDPDMPVFNLNTGTDAAMSSLMGSFRDVPQVLDEYNNKDISDYKFQNLKSITYDGDGKQKRRGATGKDLEIDEVYAPVVILGQETPQRDDNALMNRVVICEVPKKTETFTQEEINLFNELKSYEKNGLSNILFEVLKLRPLIRKEFKNYMRMINKELTKTISGSGNVSGDLTRIIKTITLFLAICKLIEEKVPSMKLPFSYEEFYTIACKKVIAQVEMITRSDKLATFFKAMEVMINTKSIVHGRDYDIDQPGKVTVKVGSTERSELPLAAGTKVLYLRLSNIYTLFARSSFNTEDASQSTIDANLRSNPAYIGVVNARRFKWNEVKEVPKGDLKEGGAFSSEMIRVVEVKSSTTSCIAMNYDVFKQYFDIDLERETIEDDTGKKVEEKVQDLPF